MEKARITIIGAGVVGLAAAYELSRHGIKDIVVVEKNIRYGAETSSRNSEVIHAGLYYPAESLKTKLCVEGNRLLYELCVKNNIPHKKIGKLIVAVDEKEFGSLVRLKDNADSIGVKGLRLLDAGTLKKTEPCVAGYGAMFSPETGIIDSEKLMHFYYSRAVDAGVLCVFGSEVVGIDPSGSGYRIRIARDNYEFETGIVINCAGLYADRVAAMTGLDIKRLDYTIKYCKGEYFKLYGAPDIKHLVYPIPGAVSLGVHLVIDLAGNMKLGPNAVYINEISYNMDESNKQEMHAEAAKYIPSIKIGDLNPDTCGIRPKLQGKNEKFRDFIIKDETGNGRPGFINLLGIESPGLTASLAIAGYVRKLL